MMTAAKSPKADISRHSPATNPDHIGVPIPPETAMIRHSQIDALRRRIAFEDMMAQCSDSPDERRGRAELAMIYRAEMRTLRVREAQRFAGSSDAG
jgi:hypothetical protein